MWRKRQDSQLKQRTADLQTEKEMLWSLKAKNLPMNLRYLRTDLLSIYFWRISLNKKVIKKDNTPQNYPIFNDTTHKKGTLKGFSQQTFYSKGRT